MNKKLCYSASIIAVFTMLYALATGAYFSGMYSTANRVANVDSFFEGYFYLLNIVGILVVSFFMKNNNTNKRMFIAYSVPLILLIILTYIITLPISQTAFLIIILFNFILFGCTQGCYVFLLTIYMPKSNRCLGLGIAASLSVIINSLFALIDNGNFVQSRTSLIVYFILAVISSVFLYIIVKKPIDSDNDTEVTSKFKRSFSFQWSTKAFITTCIFIALSWMIQSLCFYFPMNDSLVLGISAEILRIPNILGLLIAGLINTIDKKSGAIICLIILATPMLYIILQTQAKATLLVFLLSYFFTGFLSIYRYGIIADMSDSVDSKGNTMTYLCAFGLIFGRFGEGIGCLMGVQFRDNTLLLLTVTSFLLVIAVAFFIFHYLWLFIPVPKIIKSHEDMLTSFKIKYELSNREVDVLELLLDSNSNAEIADKLFISENTVRFHVSNILKKTDCKSRKEIQTLFHTDF